MDVEETRFKHLLQPIRDLAKNWNIDIAHELEDYLDQLESLSISFQEEQAQQEHEDNEDSSSSNSLNFAEAALLIQGSACIYSRKVEYLYALVYQTLDHLAAQKNGGNKKGSKKGKRQQGDDEDEEEDDEDDLCPVNEILQPLELITDLEKCSNIDLTPEDDSVSSVAKSTLSCGANFQASVALMGSLVPDERDHGDSFKLLTCSLHQSGAILLNASSDELATGVQPSAACTFQGSNPMMGEGEIAAPMMMDEGGDNYSSDGGNDMGFDDIGFDNDAAVAPEPTSTTEDLPLDQENHYEARAVSEDEEESEEEEMEDDDTWVPLDPHDTSGTSNKPFRKGKTYRKRKPKSSTSNASVQTHNGPFVENLPLEGTLFKCFDDLYKRERKAARIRNLQRRAAENRGGTAARVLAEPTLFAEPVVEEEEDNVIFGANDENDNFGYSDDDNNNFDYPEEESKVSLESAFQNASSTSSAHQPLSQWSQSQRYEEACRSHVMDFMKGSENYTKETTLSRQVASWQGRLNPILREQSKHPPFDIHDCGEKIVDKLQEDSPENDDGGGATEEAQDVEFGTVVEGMDKYEVCRMFLASLQLANTGNVELHHGKGLSTDDVPFSMKLLTTDNCFAGIQS